MRLRTICPDRNRRGARRGDRSRTRQRPGQARRCSGQVGCRTPRRSTRSSRRTRRTSAIWALNWDLLVNFSPDDLSPVPGFAKSWKVSKDKKTVTFKLIEGAKWSDGQPITSKDVKYSLEKLGSDSLIFTGYTSNVTSIETPDDTTVVIHTKQPDARIIGGLFVYMIPEHVYGKEPLKQADQDYQPPLPLVGSGPWIVTEFERGRIVTMEPQPELPRQEARLRRDPVHQVRDDRRRRAGAAARRDRHDPRGRRPPSFEQLGEGRQHQDRPGAVAVVHPAHVQPLLEAELPGREVQPGGAGPRRAPGDRLRRSTASGSTRSRRRGTSFVGHGLLPTYYKTLVREAGPGLPLRPRQGEPDARRRRLQARRRRRPAEGGRKALVRPVRALGVAPRTPRRPSSSPSRRKEIGVDFKVQVVSVDKLTEITTRKVDGKMAPDFDTFIWGWGGDPYDPSALLQLVTTDEIGGSSDSFYSNPEYDGCSRRQIGRVRHRQAQGADPPDGRPLPARPAVPRADRGPVARGLSLGPAARTSVKACPKPDRRRHLPAGLLRDHADDGAEGAAAPTAAAARASSSPSGWSWSPVIAFVSDQRRRGARRARAAGGRDVRGRRS